MRSRCVPKAEVKLAADLVRKVVLYNKILIDPWDGVFQESPFCRRPLMDYGLDPTTIDFVDAVSMPWRWIC